MIQHFKRNELDIQKYDACIETSINSRIYAYSWYLDCVADNWDALVLNDYEAVMPLPWRRKYFIKYVYPPLWIIELGIFSKSKVVDINSFLQVAHLKFKYIEQRLNSGNLSTNFSNNKYLQFVELNVGYNELVKKYNRNRKRDLKKANSCEFEIQQHEDLIPMITIFKENVGKRIKSIKEKDYQLLLKLMQICCKNKVGELLVVKDKLDNIKAATFFLMHKNQVTSLVTSSDFSDRNNGVNTYLIDQAIKKYCTNFNIFNFGGSSMKSISNYYDSFGAETHSYPFVKFNKLPVLLKVFKH